MSECEREIKGNDCNGNKYERLHKLIIQYICEKYLGYTISQACLKGIECRYTELKGRCTQYTYTCKSDDICFRFIHCPKKGLVDISCYLDVEKHELKSNELTKFTKKLIKEIIKGLFYILFGMFDTIIDNDAGEEKYNEINLEIEVNVFDGKGSKPIKIESTKTTAKHYRDNDGDMHFTSAVIIEDHHNQGDFKVELFIMEYICDEYPCDEESVGSFLDELDEYINYKKIIFSYDDEKVGVLFGITYTDNLSIENVIDALLEYMYIKEYNEERFFLDISNSGNATNDMSDITVINSIEFIKNNKKLKINDKEYKLKKVIKQNQKKHVYLK